MESNKKSHTREFMIGAVELITSGGATAAQVAKDMDIPMDTLYQWIQEFSVKPEKAFPGKGNLTSDAETIRQLRRETERLTLECEMLKKARNYSV
ncbi:MAG TPA: transposase [Geomonas sp.]